MSYPEFRYPMKARVWIKHNAADRVLAPLRKELLERIDPEVRLLDIGCGTGDLMLRAAAGIASGHGIDLDTDMIEFADRQRIQRGLTHVRFQSGNALLLPLQTYDVSTSTLCLHEMTQPEACRLLAKMVGCSKKVLIADYSTPSGFSARLGIHIDELFSGHYRNFRAYSRQGEIPAYAEQVGASISDAHASTIDGIVIWTIKGRAQQAADR